MRVLIFTPYIGANYGGIPKAVQGIAAAIAAQGIDIDVITTDANNFEKIPISLNQWLTENRYRIRYFSCLHKNDFIFSPQLINWLIHHVQEYDIVHTNTVFAPIVCFVHWLCQFRKIPYVTTPHGMLEPWALAYKASKKHLYYKFFEKPDLHRASAIQVIANTEANNISKLGFTQLVKIPNGINKLEFMNLPNSEIFYQKFPETRGKKLTLFLGRIDPKKGLDLLAPAFAKVQRLFPDTHLIIAGPDSSGFLPTVKNYFLQAGCLNAVTFAGMLTGKLKFSALVAANLYVAPSYSEGFSISVLEGMASGLPCVITTGCNFPEAATANVAHVVDINVDAIANALIHCLNHPQAAKNMGDRAREFIFKNYTWDGAAEKLVKVYQAIIHKKPFPEYQEVIPRKLTNKT